MSLPFLLGMLAVRPLTMLAGNLLGNYKRNNPSIPAGRRGPLRPKVKQRSRHFEDVSTAAANMTKRICRSRSLSEALFSSKIDGKIRHLSRSVRSSVPVASTTKFAAAYETRDQSSTKKLAVIRTFRLSSISISANIYRRNKPRRLTAVVEPPTDTSVGPF